MKFQIYEDRRGEWRWRLRARNGKIMATSGEGYKRKAACEKALNKVVNSIAEAVNGK